MAISFIAKPTGIVQPGYNAVTYVVDSTNKALPGFRYLFQLFEPSTTNLIAEFKVAAAPDGYGYIDVAKILQSYLTSTLNLTSTSWYSADSGSTKAFDIAFGEDYITSQSALRTYPAPLVPPEDQYATVAITGSIFLTGDQIRITLPTDYGDCRDAIEGVSTVRIGAVNSIVLNRFTQCGVTAGITGAYVTYADNRKTRAEGLTALSARVIYNAAIAPTEWPSWGMTADFNIGTGTRHIQTGAPTSGISIQPWQNMWWNFGDNKTNQAKAVIFQNNLGDIWELNTSGTATYLKGVNVSPGVTASAVLIAGTGSLVRAGVTYYDLWSVNAANDDFLNFSISSTPGSSLPTTIAKAGTYNGRAYYTFIIGAASFYVWWSSANSWWEVTSALGGGNQYLISSVPGNGINPPAGSYPVTWTDGTDQPYISAFTTTDIPLYATNKTSQTYRIAIDDRCAKNETQLLFLDRMGSWGSFAFTLNQEKANTTTKESYNKEYGAVASSVWTYDTYSAGNTTWGVLLEEIWTLNGDWMTDEMSVYFDQLMSSPEILVRFTANGDWQRCQIVDGSWRTERTANKTLVRKTVQIKTALQQNINI
jgi:hypothetical protein